MDTILDLRFSEIDYESKLSIAQTKICKQLYFENSIVFFNSFDFDDQFFASYDVKNKSFANFSFIDNGDANLPFDSYAS